MSTKISAADVKKLREMTGAGMMDCKKALTEAEGDFDKAIEILRKKGQKLSAKRADREANEGAVIALVNDDHTKGVVVKLSCETDFVAKNESFVKLATDIAQLALDNFPATTEELLALDFGGLTIGEKVTEQIGVIGEKVEVAEYAHLEAPMVAPYIHMGNKAGVLVGLSKTGDFFDSGRDVAMQVAAMKPIAVDENGISEETKAKEKEIGKAQAIAEGKPEQVAEKISEGKLKKYYKDNTLLHQIFVKDNKKSVGAFLKTLDGELTVTDFKHVTLG